MSKHETPLTRRFWKEVGGTLVEEFLAVRRSKTTGARFLDGLIIPDGPLEVRSTDDVEIEGKDIVVVQTKARRLGMSLLGQAVFSARIMARFNPANIRSVVVCTAGDSVLQPLAEEFGVEVIIYPATQQSVPPHSSVSSRGG